MIKKCILWLMFLPLYVNAQNRSIQRDSRSFAASVGIGSSIINTQTLDLSLLVGLKDSIEQSSFEIGYVFKRIMTGSISHRASYHGLRAEIQVNLIGLFGAYGTYDFIKGDRWLYDNPSGGRLNVRHRIYGEGTLGLFYTLPKNHLLIFIGIEPQHYDPLKLKSESTPHRSSSISLKIKHSIDL